MRQSTPQGFLSLSDELVVDVLASLPKTSVYSTSLVNKRLFSITQDPWTIATWFLRNSGKRQVLYMALRNGRTFTKRVLEILLSCGAEWNRYLLQCVASAYTKNGHPKWVHSNFANGTPFQTYVGLLSLAAEAWPEDRQLLVGRRGDDTSIIGDYISMKSYNTNSDKERVDMMWIKVCQVFQKYRFFYFDDADHNVREFPRYISIEPRLYELAYANGFRLDRYTRDDVFRHIFSLKPEEILSTCKFLFNVDPASLFISKQVASEILMEVLDDKNAYKALRRLGASDCLNFDLSDVVAKLYELLHHKWLMTHSHYVGTIAKLHEHYPTPESRTLLIIAMFTQKSIVKDYNTYEKGTVPTGNRERCKSVIRDIYSKLKLWKLLPLYKSDFCDVLVSPAAHSVTLHIVEEYWKMYFSHMTESEMEEIMKHAAVEALSSNLKGQFLHDICETWNVIDVISTEIREHMLNVDEIWKTKDLSSLKQCSLLNERYLCISTVFTEGIEDDDPINVTPVDAITTASRSTGLRILRQHRDRQIRGVLEWPEASSLKLEDWLLGEFGRNSVEIAILAEIMFARSIHTKLMNPEVGDPMPITLRRLKICVALDYQFGKDVWQRLENQPFYAGFLDYANESPASSSKPFAPSPSPQKKPVSAAIPSNDRSSPLSSAPSVANSPTRVCRQAAAAVKFYATEPELPELSGDDWSDSDLAGPPPRKKQKVDSNGDGGGGGSSATLEWALAPLTVSPYSDPNAIPTWESIVQLELWVHALQGLLNCEIKLWNERKAGVERDERGRLKNRTMKTQAHQDLVKGVPNLRNVLVERRKRYSAFATVGGDDDEYADHVGASHENENENENGDDREWNGGKTTSRKRKRPLRDA